MLGVIFWGLCHFSVTLPRPFHPVLGGILLYGDSTTLHPRALTACWVPCWGNRVTVVLGGWSAQETLPHATHRTA